MADLQGYSGLAARLTAIGETQQLMRTIGLATVAGAKRRVRRKTGTTGRTIRLASATRTSARVTVGGAGPFLEFGTRPHIIQPKRARVLRWPAKGVATTLGGRARTGAVRRLGRGAYAFAKLVHHPGTKKQPFLLPAAQEATEQIGGKFIIENWNRSG